MLIVGLKLYQFSKRETRFLTVVLLKLHTLAISEIFNLPNLKAHG